MATIVTAPDPIDTEGFKVFLGGAIDMGNAEDWQSQVINALSDTPGLVLLNPRRSEFTPEMEDEQIKWELDALRIADLVLMWFPASVEAPVSFLETGLYMQSGKLVLGVEDGFYRQRNLELTSQFYGVQIWKKLGDVVKEVLRRHTLPRNH
jgi:hypothetical protein